MPTHSEKEIHGCISECHLILGLMAMRPTWRASSRNWMTYISPWEKTISWRIYQRTCSKHGTTAHSRQGSFCKAPTCPSFQNTFHSCPPRYGIHSQNNWSGFQSLCWRYVLLTTTIRPRYACHWDIRYRHICMWMHAVFPPRSCCLCDISNQRHHNWCLV